MNLTDTEVLKFQKGTPVFLDDICAIYPATLGEIVDLGYDKFQQYLSVILANKPMVQKQENAQLQKILENLTDFQYVLMTAELDVETNRLLKASFKFFCHEDILFSLEPAQIIVGPLNEQHFLTEEKFYDLQRIIKHMYFVEEGEDIIISKDDSPGVRALKMKMRANREKVRLAKARQAEREKSDLKFSDLIGSITINNCGLNMENIWNITYYAFQDQLKRMSWRDQFNINNQAALAGAKLKKSQLKHWMRSIASSDKS